MAEDKNGFLTEIGLEIKRGGTLEDIHQLLLIQEADDVVKWLHPELMLNFFQLSILNERFDLVQYLAIHYPVFLDCFSTYKASYQYLDVVDQTLLLNAPLHLACLVGNLDIVRYTLDHKESATLSSVSLLNLDFDVDNGVKKLNKIECREEVRSGKAFEFSIIGGNIECIDYLLTNHIIQCLALRFLYAGVREPSSLLHKACSIGCAPMIELLLKKSFKDVVQICDRNGKTPLHLAAWNGNTKSIEILLDYGANVNCKTESRNCLHILYRSKLHPYNYKKNTQVFLSHGLHAHAVDKNGKSALHILCEEIGISRIDVMCFWKKAADAIADMTMMSNPQNSYTVESYQRDLLDCLELLLKHGLNPNQMSMKVVGSQVPLEVLLQYSSLPYSQATLNLNPELIYKAIELLLKHGADPNFQCHITNTTIFNHFIRNHIKDMDDNLRIQFINLFCQYGANPELPLSSVDPVSLPAVLYILEWKEGQKAAHVILSYCSLPHVQRVISLLKTQSIPRLMVRQSRASDQYAQSLGIRIDYLNHLVVKSQMRSLKHSCKFVILQSLRRNGELINQLSLPQVIKNYLSSSDF